MRYNASMTTTKPCLCGDPRGYDHCCGPIHTDISSANTAESLMRARYSAYSLDNLDFIRQSWHHSTFLDDVKPNETGFIWTALDIIDTEKGTPDDSEGIIEFIAHYSINGQPGQLRERSRFLREAGQWRYLDGKASPIKSEKIGRNAACPCGSGKKYKRCCIQAHAKQH